MLACEHSKLLFVCVRIYRKRERTLMMVYCFILINNLLHSNVTDIISPEHSGVKSMLRSGSGCKDVAMGLPR